MDFVFREKPMEYLDRIVLETLSQEQTAELIVPDSLPDAERVIDAAGTVLIRSEDCASDSATVAGNVQANVLIVTEDGQMQQLQAQIPFSFRKEYPSQEDCSLSAQCTLRGIDARMLNSRKILLRVNICCTLCVYAEKKQVFYDVEEPSEKLQLKRVTLPMQLGATFAAKSFTLNEELELPEGATPLDRLLRCTYATEVEDEKVVGSKAVFKGALLVHALYEGVDGKTRTQDWRLPFSNYVQLERECEDCALDTDFALTAAETEPDGQLECRRLLLSVTMIAQCTARRSAEICYIADAYCTDAEFAPVWEQWEAEGVLDVQEFRETLSAQCDTGAQAVIEARLIPEEAVIRREGETVQIEQPFLCGILYLDTDGQPQARTMRAAVTCQTVLAENGNLRVQLSQLGELFTNAGSDAIQLRCPITLRVESSARQQIRCVSGGEITPDTTQHETRASVLLRRAEGEEDLWQIAKENRTAVRAIMEANALTEPIAPAGTMLLIPM